MVLLLVDEAGGCFAVPGIGVGQRGDEFSGGGLSKAWWGAGCKAIGGDAVEAAAIVAGIEVEVLLDSGRKRPRVFDDLAIHVDDPERSIRSVGHLHGTEP